MLKEKRSWPPTDDEIKDVASSALDSNEKKNVKVLVYWENNPNLMIFDPIMFSRTEYVQKKYTCEGRSVEVIIGKVD